MTQDDRRTPPSAKPSPPPAGAAAPPPAGTSGPSSVPLYTLQKDIVAVKNRIVREASTVIGMLEAAIDGLLRQDPGVANTITSRDDEVDREEVAIEEECFRVLALFNPLARDFRTMVALLRVNADLERVADHAVSLAKLTAKIVRYGGVREYPTSLRELGHRVPMLCQLLLRSLVNDDLETARAVLVRDKSIDNLDKRLFDESLDTMGDSRESRALGLLLYRCGRELERVGDLMTNIAEDVIYINTGQIVRHGEKKRLRAIARAAEGGEG
jgi:phosphate transport system protein